ncbi:hypothetical protein VB796_18465 [Arcicella sp. LKC2W]|uniref:hypothetical protein n=1 Tax=Arcicella sp. LKC2W TaxID=2984198 RepID=UPI002B21C03D|nr:hypothetical protein [Arcicella sp. LKC2W]MEA5461052.1 hypothetical protein [Arcicella sp. LKC2W]
MEKIIPSSCKVIIILLFFSFSVCSQVRMACNCESVTKGFVSQDGFANQDEIVSWVNFRFLPLFNEMAQKRHSKTPPIKGINVIPVFCVGGNGAVAKKCEKEKASLNGNPFLILYDDYFINKIEKNNALNVLFVLAHEMGHLLSNHYHNTIPVDVDYEAYLKKTVKGYKPVFISKDVETQKMTVRERHIEELTADAFAVWFLRMYYEKNKKDPNIAKKFDPDKINDVLPQIKSVFPSMFNQETTHPSCEQRTYFVKKLNDFDNWSQVSNFKKTLGGFASEFIDSTLTVLTQEEAKQMGLAVERAKEKTEGDALRIKGLDLFRKNYFEEAKVNLQASREIYTRLIFPEDSAKVTAELKEVEEILSVRSFMHFSILGNSSFANYQLKSEGQNINATNAIVGQLGLRLGRYSYDSPFGLEVDATYDLEAWQFDTYSNDRKSLERFKTSTITVQPKLTYRFLSFSKSNKIQGFVFSAGASWMKPIKFEYLNFQVPAQNLGIRLKPSWGFTVGIGFENINRKPTLNIWGLCRVAIVSSYQPLVFDISEPLPQNYSAAAWTVGLSASVGILPKFLIKRKLDN